MDNMPPQINTNETKKKNYPTIEFLILAAVIVIELIYVVRVLVSPTPPAIPVAKVAPITDGSIALTAVKNEYTVGETVPVTVRIDTGGHGTQGSDVLIKYDPRILEANGTSVMVKGEVYKDYPVLIADPKTLMITISGISSLEGDKFKGNGIFATVNFKAKAMGSTALTVQFTKDSSTDSNMVDAESGNDSVGSVSNLDITVK